MCCFCRQAYLICPAVNKDIEATANCLTALGAQIERTEQGYYICPVKKLPMRADLNCNESGSTLRFMLPIAASLGVTTIFHMSGRLPSRPMSPLWEELERMGCHLSRPTDNTILCEGQLRSGAYSIDGSISSQFITGLLFALALLPGNNTLQITGKVESKPYIRMTEDALSLFGVNTADYRFCNCTPFLSPGTVVVEGDWSNGAFFHCANALGNQITVEGLRSDSSQGDRAIMELLPSLDLFSTIYGEDVPDLIPVLAVTAGAKNGARFQNIGRLRLKESDRIASVAAMLQAFGAQVQVGNDSLDVMPSVYKSCTIDAEKDHRIAMAAAIASTVAQGPVTILGADCVSKSYPSFWLEFKKLGGYYEQHIR